MWRLPRISAGLTPPGEHQRLTYPTIERRIATVLLLSALASACGGGGGSTTASNPAVAANQLPTAVVSTTSTDGFAPLTVDFDAAASTDGDGEITGYRWDFGDGSPVLSGARVSHTFTDPRGYNVELTLTDDEGASTSTLIYVRVRGSTISGTIQVLSTSAVDSDVNDRLTATTSNNDFLNAQPISSPVSIGGFVNQAGTGESTGNFFSNGDPTDFYALRLSGNELILLNIGDAAADLDLRLWDSAQNLVDASLGVQATESLSVPAAGDYFVEVFAASAATNIAGGSNYVLRIGQDLNVSNRAASRLSDAFVPGELLLAPSRASDRPRLKQHYDLAEQGRAGRYFRAKLGGRTEQRIAERLMPRGLTTAADLIPSRGLTSSQQRKYQTLMALKQLPGDPDVGAVEPNLILAPNLTPNDPFYALQWHLREIGLPAAWDLTTGTATGPEDVIVAVVDTGILPAHPDFAGQLVDGYDFISDASRARDFNGIDNNPTDEGDFAFGASSSFHGTHVAGTVAARTDNSEGVAGVAWGAKLMPLRALGVDGGTTFDVMQAVRYAAGLSNDSGRSPVQRADIINLSLGSPFFSASAQATIDEARAAGVILIASAGNESSSAPNYPAAYNGVVAVSATTIDGSIAPYSNFGAIDVAAPGGYNATDVNADGFGDGVLSTLGDDSNPGSVVLGYGALNGTSMAAPHVAGVAALMKAVHPALTPAEFDAALAAGDLTDDQGTAGYDQFYGHGLINAQKAVLAALALTAGGGTDPGPVLASSLSAVNLGVLAGVQTVTLSNAGSGSIQIDQTVASQPWLAISPVSVDPVSRLGEYELRVDRSSLNEGAYNATARFVPQDPATNAVSISITLQVAGADPAADAGLFYVIAVREDGSTEGNAAVVAASNGEYRYTLNDLPTGTYRIFAGSDMDDDGYLCDAGEACGAYRTLDALERLTIDPATTPTLSDVSFVSEFRAVITNQATAQQSNSAQASGALDGDPNRAPMEPERTGILFRKQAVPR